MGKERCVIMPRQFWIPKLHANIDTTPGEAKSQSQKAARKGDRKWITPYDNHACFLVSFDLELGYGGKGSPQKHQGVRKECGFLHRGC